MIHEQAVNDDLPSESAEYQRGIAAALTAVKAYLPAALHEIQQTQPPSDLMRSLTFLPRADSARLNYQAGSLILHDVLMSKIDELLINQGAS